MGAIYFILGLFIGAGCGYAFRGYIGHKIAAAGSAAKQGVQSAAGQIEKKL